MKNIGIDFGTTTSIISYFENDEPKLFYPRDGAGSLATPSVVAKKKDGKYAIGDRARGFRKSAESFIAAFKLLLGEDRATKAARRYLRELIGIYKDKMKVSDIENIVITVPDLWLRTGGQRQLSALRGVCDELNLGHAYKTTLSEPVAAAAYYVNRLQSQGDTFCGHALVYDHGGGTLDLALVEIDDKQEIEVVSGGGDASIGGNVFDEAVFEALSATNVALPSDREGWLEEFETYKINHCDDIGDGLRAWKHDPLCDDPLFEVGGCPIHPSILASTFDKVIARTARATVETVMEENSDTVNFDDPNAFRLVIVGGFSAFPMVEDMLRDIFKARGLNDARFDHGLSPNERQFAVARGACLHAAKATAITQTCPLTIRLVLLDGDGYSTRPVDLVRRGEWLDDLTSPRMCDVTVYAPTEDKGGLADTPLQFVVGEGAYNREIQSDGVLRNLVPNFRTARAWRVGARVDDDLVVYVVFEEVDGFGSHKETPIGSLARLREHVSKSGSKR